MSLKLNDGGVSSVQSKRKSNRTRMLPGTTPSDATLAKRHDVALYLSSEAYRKLTQQAKALNYVAAYAYRNRGLGSYINELLKADFFDNRPEDLRQLDVRRLMAGKWPLWSYGLGKWSYNIRLKPGTRLKLLDLSKEYGIVAQPNNVKSFSSLNGRQNSTLDAIGRGMLHPTTLPLPYMLRHFRERSELSW